MNGLDHTPFLVSGGYLGNLQRLVPGIQITPFDARSLGALLRSTAFLCAPLPA